MTAQISDEFNYGGVRFSLAGISEGELFDPSLLDLKPVAGCTACWRGYQAVFAVSDQRLVLDTLHINLADETNREPLIGPPINGVTPTGDAGKPARFFNNDYVGINYHLEYSGGLLLADGFIRNLYVHMGFHPAWKYERVIELIFENGVLIAEHDRSEQMAELRRQIVDDSKQQGPPALPTKAEIEQFVDRAFDRKYRR